MHPFRKISPPLATLWISTLLCLICLGSFTPAGHGSLTNKITTTLKKKLTPNPETFSFILEKKDLYDSLNLEALGLKRSVFEMALKGMAELISIHKIQSNILSIADFSQPSMLKRLYVIDLDQATLLFNTWVAHGKNSGTSTANSFSNKPRSNKSSLGFYITGTPYQGNNGYSLKLLGMEPGFNNNAFKRAIVIHGADYVDPSFIAAQGYIGRSQGCPAVPAAINTPLIEQIKEGTCFFVYHPSKLYNSRSPLLH